MTENFNILIIDDEESMRDSLKQMLNRKLLNIGLAENGDMGLKIMQNKSFDIVNLDLKMPGISGMETLKRIKQD